MTERPSRSSTDQSIDRRSVLTAAGTGTAVAVAGCLGGDDEGQELPFEDDMSDLDAVYDPATDVDGLTFDDTNVDEFARPDGADEETDGSRVNRVEATDTHLAYRFSEAISSVRIELHVHVDEPSDVSVERSEDGEEWTDLDAEPEIYNPADGDEAQPGPWWDNAELAADVEGEAQLLRLTLEGDAEEWTPQVGHVEVE